MNFVPGFAPDAFGQWRALDFEAQERVLDELEYLVADVPQGHEHLVDVVWDSAGIRHYLFLRLMIDRERYRIVAIGVGYWKRKL